MTRNRPPTPNAPAAPNVPASEPEIERQLMNETFGKVTDSKYLTVFCIEALETFMEGSGLAIDEDGFIIVAETGAAATPYTYSHGAFSAFDGVSDQHLIDYFEPVDAVREFIPQRDRLHITDLHGFVPGTDATTHQHPVPNDAITIHQYNAATGCTLPAVTAWSSVWENAWESHADAFTGNNLIIQQPLTGTEPELTCLRCDFTAPVPEWNAHSRRDTQEIGVGDIHTCPECSCQWDTNSVSTCSDCGTASSAEELTYTGTGVHVESRCPDCGSGPVRDHVTDRYGE